jgi:RNA polymerase sigma factor (sigma-70 family)
MDWQGIYEGLRRNRGDEAWIRAWHVLWEHVRGWARRRLPNLIFVRVDSPATPQTAERFLGEVVDDIANDTCVNAIEHLDQLRVPEAFQSWVYHIMMNEMRRALRTLRFGPSVMHVDPALLDELFPDEGSDPQQQLEQQPVYPSDEELARLRRCLWELPARQRRAIELRFFPRLPFAAVAAALSTPAQPVTEANARTIYKRAMYALKRSLEATGGDQR